MSLDFLVFFILYNCIVLHTSVLILSQLSLWISWFSNVIFLLSRVHLLYSMMEFFSLFLLFLFWFRHSFFLYYFYTVFSYFNFNLFVISSVSFSTKRLSSYFIFFWLYFFLFWVYLLIVRILFSVVISGFLFFTRLYPYDSYLDMCI